MASPAEDLMDIEVVTSVPLTVLATARVRDALGDERDVEITEAVGVTVTEGHGAALNQGLETCDRLAVVPGSFNYEVGRDAVIRYTHLDEDQKPCCWLPVEWIDAVLVAEVEIPKGSGGVENCEKKETKVASIPRPAAPVRGPFVSQWAVHGWHPADSGCRSGAGDGRHNRRVVPDRAGLCRR